MEKKNKPRKLTQEEIQTRAKQIYDALDKLSKEMNFIYSFGCGCCNGGIRFTDEFDNSYEV